MNEAAQPMLKLLSKHYGFTENVYAVIRIGDVEIYEDKDSRKGREG